VTKLNSRSKKQIRIILINSLCQPLHVKKQPEEVGEWVWLLFSFGEEIIQKLMFYLFVCGQLAEDQINTVVVIAVHFFPHLREKKALLGRYNPAYKAPKLKSYPPRVLHLLKRCPWQMSPPCHLLCAWGWFF